MTKAISRFASALAAAFIAATLPTPATLAQEGPHRDGGDQRHWVPRPGRMLAPPERGLVSRGGWDPARHNGFWYSGRWYYGPPPREYGVGEVRPGHSAWRRGGYLPSYYHGAVIEDYARFRLRRPPYGYRWVYAGGDYMLVAASSGLIFDVVPGR